MILDVVGEPSGNARQVGGRDMQPPSYVRCAHRIERGDLAHLTEGRSPAQTAAMGEVPPPESVVHRFDRRDIGRAHAGSRRGGAGVGQQGGESLEFRVQARAEGRGRGESGEVPAVHPVHLLEGRGYRLRWCRHGSREVLPVRPTPPRRPTTLAACPLSDRPSWRPRWVSIERAIRGSPLRCSVWHSTWPADRPGRACASSQPVPGIGKPVSTRSTPRSTVRE
ncbi:Uncharacterised protein [Mycobacteroides abscessus subsp. abscessus]|nr:Uncharacterised protein [Mycobacteroides abscessus subsp. abscessus]